MNAQGFASKGAPPPSAGRSFPSTAGVYEPGQLTEANPAAVDVSNWRGGNAAAQQAAGGLLDAPMSAQQASSRSLLDINLQDYENPWLDSVVSSSLAGYDERRGMEEAEMRAQQARNQKFSGSGDAIRRAMFDRGTLQDRTGIESNLRAQGFDRATGLATSDLNREAQTSQFNASQGNSMTAAERDAQLRSAGLLGDLANNQAANERADLGLLSELGAQERTIDREERTAPIQLLELISALNSGQPYELFRGQTSTGNATSTTTGKQYGLGNTLATAGDLMRSIGSMAKGVSAFRAGGAG